MGETNLFQAFLRLIRDIDSLSGDEKTVFMKTGGVCDFEKKYK